MIRASFVAAIGLILAGCALESRELTLAVSTEEPVPSIAESIRTILAAEGIRVSIEAVADPTEIIAAISEGTVDLAVIEEPDRPVAGVTTLAPLYPTVLHVLYNAAEPPADFAALIRGASIYAGPANGNAYRLLMQLAVDFDVRADEFTLLDNPWTVNPDVYFVFGGLLTAESRQQLAGYRLYSFAQADDVVDGSVADGIVLKHHYLKSFTLPASTYFSLGKTAVETLSIRSVLAAGNDLDSETAFRIASALFVNAQEIATDYPLVTRELNERVSAVDLILPLHEGARQYLDRDRPGYLERNVEVIGLVFTVLVTLVSGLVALYRYRQQVRKDRVDDYYGKVLDIRGAMDAATGADEQRVLRNRAIDVQNEVFTLLIDERISADASLIAFLSLSNQVINELDRRIAQVA